MFRPGGIKIPWIWLAPVIVYGLAFLAGRTEIVRQFEWRTLDWRTQFRALFQKPPDPRVAVVLFEDSTDANLVAWPPDRAWHGNFNEFIATEKPAVVTWDVILDASREGEGDAKMGLGTKAASDAGTKVVIGAVTNTDPPDTKPGPDGPTKPLTQVEGDIKALIGDEYALVPFPELRAVAPYGFTDAPRGSDGIIREVPLVVRVGKKVYASLSLQTVMSYYNVPAEKVRVNLGDAIYLPTKDRTLRLPISKSGQFLLNYRYDQDENFKDFPTYGYGEVLVKINEYRVEKKPNAPKPPNLAGKIVFVGQYVTGKADAGPTPRNSIAPLVLIHANLLNNVLAQDFAWRVPEWFIWMTALALGYAGLGLLANRSVMLLISGALFGLVSYASLALWAWVLKSAWFPLAAPLAGFGGLQFIVISRRVLQEQRAKQQIKGMFGAYVSPQLVNRLIAAGVPPQLGGHEEEITAYFSDIQSFSSFSEKLPPDRLVELMNEYLTACTDIIQEEGGTLDKYIGDAVVAMFGAPIALPDHAYRACIATQRVQVRLSELRTTWQSQGDKWPEVVWKMQSRIGLNSGAAVIGNMGSRTRFNYTMMGDNVNLAARMESGAKSWGAYTMCTEATKSLCEQHGGDRVVFRPLGRIVVKGRTQAVPIFEIVGLKENVSPQAIECVGLFTQGLEKYYARDWNGALELFEQSKQLEPNIPGKTPGVVSNPSLVYLDITAHYKKDSPPEPWDGVYIMKEK